MKKTYIIAEAGVNHNGKLDLAIELANKAKQIGADCVKYQTFKASQIVTATSPKANYQLKVTDQQETQFEMLKKLELSQDDFLKIKLHCDKIGIEFMSTPYNQEDVDLLNNIGVKSFKIASGQLVEPSFLRYVAQFKKRMIVSTGMASLSEVYEAVKTIQEAGNQDVVILQCNTDYPSKIEDTNLLAMCSMREALKVSVGYSDHVANNYACFAAVALGAEVIEKHFTLDKKMEGPDHSCSLEPEEFKELIAGIRNIEKALGHGVKTPSDSEIKNTFGMRRSMVFTQDLSKGELLQAHHIGFKRPANGMSPKMYDQVLGKMLTQDVSKDEPLTFQKVSI